MQGFCKLSIIFSILVLASALSDPYKTLGISRKASVQEIKRAYKQLAREWHPDKNKDPEAEEKFVEITKAYELLMDPERKENFDRYGHTEDTPNFRQRPDYSQFNRYEYDPFESILMKEKAYFTHNFNQGSFYHRSLITLKSYENRVIPESNHKPYLILFFGDFCFPCLHVEPAWQRIVQELEPLGVGFATIHAQREATLAKKIGVSALPYIVGIIEGRPIHYRREQISLMNVVEFCRSLFPRNLIISADETSVDSFLNGWSDNRVRVLIFSNFEPVKIRYLLVAYHFYSRASFAFVKLGATETESVRKRYGINLKRESLLVFNENTVAPIATLSMTELAPQTMRDVLETNKFLILPRLSSQAVFDQLCPPEALRTRRQLCVVLVTHNIAAHDPLRTEMREYIQRKDFASSRVRFMFVYKEKQPDFINALSSQEGSPEDPVLHLVILWRKDQTYVQYQWIDAPWESDEEKVNKTKEELERALNHLLHSADALPYDAKLSSLIDEHAHGLLTRIVKRLILMGDVLRDSITRYEVLPALSILLSCGFIVLIGYFMSYLVQMEERSVQEKFRQKGQPPPGTAKPKPESRLSVHELRGETYNGLVRLLKPGCRTIVLLIDNDSKPKLLPQFYRAVYPYRKNKTLMFAFLMVEKNLEWYRRLLLQTLGEDRELNINPKNCIGTVLSLNGHRKYFCVYHAKYVEPALLKRKKESSGDFIGFEDSTSDSETSDIESGKLLKKQEEIEADMYCNILFQEHLLDGLQNWLDRLFEGTTKRYYIQFWPECMK